MFKEVAIPVKYLWGYWKLLHVRMEAFLEEEAILHVLSFSTLLSFFSTKSLLIMVQLLLSATYSECGSLGPISQNNTYCCSFLTDSETQNHSPKSMRKLNIFCETRIISNFSSGLKFYGSIIFYWGLLSETRQVSLGAMGILNKSLPLTHTYKHTQACTHVHTHSHQWALFH